VSIEPSTNAIDIYIAMMASSSFLVEGGVGLFAPLPLPSAGIAKRLTLTASITVDCAKVIVSGLVHQ